MCDSKCLGFVLSARRIVIEVPYHIKAMTHTHTVYKLLPEKSLSTAGGMSVAMGASQPAPAVAAVAAAAAPKPQAYPPVMPTVAFFPEHRARLSFASRAVPPGHNQHVHVNLQGSLHHTESRMS